MAKEWRVPWFQACLAAASISALASCGASNDPGSGGGSNGGGTDPGSFQPDFVDNLNPTPNGGGGRPGPGGSGSEFGSGCKKVDLVFTVDNSSSMTEEREALARDVFPAFAKALKNVGGGLEDYRVGVADACPSPASLHVKGTGGACNFDGGQVWMQSSSPKLDQEFACVGAIDSSDVQCSGNNDDEQPASAATAIVEASLTGKGNVGFVRKDALLVIVAITDEDEQPAPRASVEELFNRMKALKGNDVSRMVFLGIGGATDCRGVYGSADEAETLKELTGRFEAANRGVFWDLCTGRLEDGLTKAMTVINQACEQFTPVVL
ncbi:MAG: VWA domain-containing protein [Myxococcales bacterium]|nr:VWA domain-containing protein [Myxococcales bacterium]